MAWRLAPRGQSGFVPGSHHRRRRAVRGTLCAHASLGQGWQYGSQLPRRHDPPPQPGHARLACLLLSRLHCQVGAGALHIAVQSDPRGQRWRITRAGLADSQVGATA
nr:hypothetical protein [Tanacetum cinerariifolium]